MNTSFKYLAMGLLAVSLVSCHEDVIKADYDRVATQALPVVKTGDVVVDFGASFVIGMEVTPDAKVQRDEQGLLVGTNQELSLVDEKTQRIVVSLDEAGKGMVPLTGLDDKATYYYRAYASNKAGQVAYGEVKSFTTNAALAESVELLRLDFQGDEAQGKFTPVGLAEGAQPPVYFDLTPIGMGTKSWLLSCMDAKKLSGGGVEVGEPTDNVLTYPADLTGVFFPKVSFKLLNMDALTGQACPAKVQVLASEKPITTAAEADAAVVLKEFKFADAGKTAVVDVEVPFAFMNKKCFISIRNKSLYQGKGKGDLGVAVYGFAITSMKKK